MDTADELNLIEIFARLVIAAMFGSESRTRKHNGVLATMSAASPDGTVCSA